MTKTAWPADNIERRKLSDLVPYARNSRTHSDAQVDQIAASIREWGFTNPILIDEDGGVIAGHGRILAAQKLGITELPTMTATGWTDAQKQAYIIADNQLAIAADWDMDLLKVELQELQELDGLDFDLDLVGFDADELVDILDQNTDDSNYSREIVAPIYEIHGDSPTIESIYSEAKTQILKGKIADVEMAPAIRNFLNAAANRHTTFNFSRIAEYYAHSSKPIQLLMEESALVIIDFDRALELGFVEMSKKMCEISGRDSLG